MPDHGIVPCNTVPVLFPKLLWPARTPSPTLIFAAIEAQLKLSDVRLSQMTQLYERDSGRAFVQQRQSEVRGTPKRDCGSLN
jgi:hypothetical protein